MLRSITGFCSLAEGGQLELVACDKYMRPLGKSKVYALVGADGAFSAELEVLDKESCWVADNVYPKRAFWVSECDTVQTVDLRDVMYGLGQYPTYGEPDKKEVVHNAKAAISKYAIGCPITVQEEKRMICNILDIETCEDARICTMNENLIKDEDELR